MERKAEPVSRNAKGRILFVDDEQTILDLFDFMLSDYKSVWQVDFAVSVDQALEKVAVDEFDVIVTDISMPKRNGFELIGELQARPETRNIPVIVLTGQSDADLKRRALDLGATDLLNKPVSEEDLVSRLTSALRLKYYQDQLKRQNDLLEQRVRERTRELELSRLDIVGRLAKAGEYRDEDTGDHVFRVSLCCRLIAEALGMDRDFVEMIFITSPLHDIGKIGIPDAVLLKPGKLNAEEWTVMQTHASIGAGILQGNPKGFEFLVSAVNHFHDAPPQNYSNPLLQMAADIALGHHEKWNGKGYPRGLKGEGIPIESRIVSLVDVYDALSSARPYKAAFPGEKVEAIMSEEAGVSFDPEIYGAFNRSLGDIRSIRRM